MEELRIHRELECLRAEGARYRNRDRINRRRRKYLEVLTPSEMSHKDR